MHTAMSQRIVIIGGADFIGAGLSKNTFLKYYLMDTTDIDYPENIL